ncbi:integral membrane protein [Diplocarpon mali]|nr:integral membrane protein [Diplocarpon mali]
MLLRRLLPLPALVSGVVAQLDILYLATAFPACTLQCSLEILPPAGCDFNDMRSCLCTNHDLQYQVSVCAMHNCTVPEQYQSLTVFQNHVCDGIPQPSRGPIVLRSAILLACFTFPIVVLRFISRVVIAQKIWWDDWTLLVTAIFMLPMVVVPIYPAAGLGMGKHFYNLFYATQIFYVLTQTLGKISILLLYLRIFPYERFRGILLFAMAVIACHAVAFVFAVVFQCTPVRSIWDRQIPGHCINRQAMIYTGAGISIFEDFAIMFIPILELRRLNMSRRKRAAIGFMFAVGSFATVTSIVRLFYITSYGNSVDETWYNVDLIIWSTIETYSAAICACLMCIRPLLLKWLPGPLNSSLGGSESTNPSWAQKVSSKLRHSWVFGMAPQDVHSTVDSLDSESRDIHVTLDSSISFERKEGQPSLSIAREKEDSETLASSDHVRIR